MGHSTVLGMCIEPQSLPRALRGTGDTDNKRVKEVSAWENLPVANKAERDVLGGSAGAFERSPLNGDFSRFLLSQDPTDEREPTIGRWGRLFQAQGLASTKALGWKWAPRIHQIESKPLGLERCQGRRRSGQGPD